MIFTFLYSMPSLHPSLFRISEEDYVKAIKEEINKVVKLQEELDIDVLVHGEPEVWALLCALAWVFKIQIPCFSVERTMVLILPTVWMFLNIEERYGRVLWRAVVRFCLHCQWMGAILWISLCEATNHLWWCEPTQANDSLLVHHGSEHDCSPNEGNAYRPCYYSELVLRAKWPAQVLKKLIKSSLRKMYISLKLIIVCMIYMASFQIWNLLSDCFGHQGRSGGSWEGWHYRHPNWWGCFERGLAS